MIWTLHKGLGPLDSKVNETTTFTLNVFEKNARKIMMLKYMPDASHLR